MKAFLKPAKIKIIIFLLIALLAFTIGQSKNGAGAVPRGGVAPWCYEWIETAAPLWPLAYVIPLCIDDIQAFGDWNYVRHKLTYFNRSIQFLNPLRPFVITLAASIIYWYFLSCLVVFTYDHIKKTVNHYLKKN